MSRFRISSPRMTRRSALASGLAASTVLSMPAISRAGSRPVFTHGVQSGDVSSTGGVVWTRADRPSRIALEVATTKSFDNARTVAMLDALPDRISR